MAEICYGCLFNHNHGYDSITSNCCAALPLDWNGTAVTNTLQTNSASRWITEGSEPILEMNLSSLVLIDASLSALYIVLNVQLRTSVLARSQPEIGISKCANSSSSSGSNLVVLVLSLLQQGDTLLDLLVQILCLLFEHWTIVLHELSDGGTKLSWLRLFLELWFSRRGGITKGSKANEHNNSNEEDKGNSSHEDSHR